MSYSRTYRQRIAIHYSGYVDYPASEHGGSQYYSGTEYDLLTGKLTVYTEGVKIDRTAIFKGSARARQVYGELLAAAEALLALVKTRKGCSNKDNAKLTSQIRQLREKWQD